MSASQRISDLHQPSWRLLKLLAVDPSSDACTPEPLRTGAKPYPDASLGAECYGRPWDDRSVRLPFQAETLDHRSQDQDCFHHSKPVPNADPRSASKRHVGEPRKLV